MSVIDGQARPLRWLVAVPLSVPPSGRFMTASGERFKNLMTTVGPKAETELSDTLGADARARVSLAFGRPRDFRLSEVMERVDVLKRLLAVATELERGGKVEAAVDTLRRTVGAGSLMDAAQRLLGGDDTAPATSEAPAAPPPSSSPPPAAAASPRSGGDSESALDAIFGKADVVAPAPSDDAATVAKSSIDAFIGAMRESKGPRPAKPAPRGSQGRRLAALVRRAAHLAGIELMATEPLATLETGWRGLRMVISASPGADDLSIDLIDSDHTDLAARLERRLDVPPMDRPDAVFVGVNIDDTATLAALAQLGARAEVPIVVDIDPDIMGAALGEDERATTAEAWNELRARPESAWLCAVTNPVVLANEELDDLQRTVYGSPTLAIAAMVSASVGQTGGPGQIFGRAGALVAPATVRHGKGDSAVYFATAQLVRVEHQQILAERGILLLSGERGSDRLRLAAAPMVAAGDDPLPLPGRILAGRAARFTRAIRDELPPGATEQEVAAQLAQVSGKFLPRGQGAVALSVRMDPDGKVGVDTSIGAGLAGATFKFSSDL